MKTRKGFFCPFSFSLFESKTVITSNPNKRKSAIFYSQTKEDFSDTGGRDETNESSAIWSINTTSKVVFFNTQGENSGHRLIDFVVKDFFLHDYTKYKQPYQ